MQESNPTKAPIENNLRLIKANEDEQLVGETLYRSLVGSLLNIVKQNLARHNLGSECALKFHGQAGKLPLVG